MVTVDAAVVLALADEGYPWQSSIGIWADEVKFIEGGQSVKVNGQMVDGPADIWVTSYVRECSFVSLGADAGTAAISLETNEDDQSTFTKGKIMNLDELKKDFKELFQEVFELGVASINMEALKEEGMLSGVENERARVQSLLDSGADDKVVRVAIDNGTSPSDAYKEFFEAEKAKRVDALSTLKDNATDTQGQNLSDDDGPRPFLDLVDEYQKEKKCTKAEAMKVVTAKFPESHKAFLEK